MADIDSILAGVGGNTRADFSAIGDLPKAYWEGKDQRAKNDLREAFKGGLPMKGDQIDWPTVTQKFFQTGAIDQGIAAAGQGLAQQKMLYGQQAGDSAYPTGAQPTAAPIIAPSANRGPPIPSGAPVRAAPAGIASSPQGDQPGSIVGLVSAAGIPDELAGPYIQQISAQTKMDPNASLNPELTQRVQQVAQAAAQRLKGGQQPQPTGLAPQGAPQMQPQQAPQMQPAQQPPAPDFNQRFNAARPGQGIDQTLGGLVPAGRTPGQQMDLLSRQIASGNLTPEQAKLNLARIDAIKSAVEPTPAMKEARDSGLTLQQHQERQGEQAAQQAGATETAKAYVTKYNNIDEAGTKAIQEIPKLQVALKQMDSPDFQSGSGNRFDLAYRRLAVRLGGDPDKAAPQEIVSKVIADSVLNGLGSLKGLGPIRVAEMNLARTAAMSMDNTPQTNRFLANVALRIQQRAVDVSDMAQNYNDGVLDVGFDKKIREMDKNKPLFTPDEVQRFQKIIDGKEKQAPQQNTASFANQKFSSPDEARAAGAKAGDIVTDASGKQWRLR